MPVQIDYINREREKKQMSLFYVDISILDHEPNTIGYDSIATCLEDVPLKSLFDEDLITACWIRNDTKQITKLPIMTWGRFTDHLISSSATILREMN